MNNNPDIREKFSLIFGRFIGLFTIQLSLFLSAVPTIDIELLQKDASLSNANQACLLCNPQRTAHVDASKALTQRVRLPGCTKLLHLSDRHPHPRKSASPPIFLVKINNSHCVFLPWATQDSCSVFSTPPPAATRTPREWHH